MMTYISDCKSSKSHPPIQSCIKANGMIFFNRLFDLLIKSKEALKSKLEKSWFERRVSLMEELLQGLESSDLNKFNRLFTVQQMDSDDAVAYAYEKNDDSASKGELSSLIDFITVFNVVDFIQRSPPSRRKYCDKFYGYKDIPLNLANDAERKCFTDEMNTFRLLKCLPGCSWSNLSIEKNSSSNLLNFKDADTPGYSLDTNQITTTKRVPEKNSKLRSQTLKLDIKLNPHSTIAARSRGLSYIITNNQRNSLTWNLEENRPENSCLQILTIQSDQIQCGNQLFPVIEHAALSLGKGLKTNIKQNYFHQRCHRVTSIKLREISHADLGMIFGNQQKYSLHTKDSNQAIFDFNGSDFRALPTGSIKEEKQEHSIGRYSSPEPRKTSFRSQSKPSNYLKNRNPGKLNIAHQVHQKEAKKKYRLIHFEVGDPWDSILNGVMFFCVDQINARFDCEVYISFKNGNFCFNINQIIPNIYLVDFEYYLYLLELERTFLVKFPFRVKQRSTTSSYLKQNVYKNSCLKIKENQSGKVQAGSQLLKVNKLVKLARYKRIKKSSKADYFQQAYHITYNIPKEIFHAGSGIVLRNQKKYSLHSKDSNQRDIFELDINKEKQEELIEQDDFSENRQLEIQNHILLEQVVVGQNGHSENLECRAKILTKKDPLQSDFLKALERDGIEFMGGICRIPVPCIEKSKHKDQISQDVSPKICKSPNKILTTLNQATDEKTRKLQDSGIISPYLRSNNRGDIEFSNNLISKTSRALIGEQDQEIRTSQDDSLDTYRSIINCLSKSNPEINFSDPRSNNQGDVIQFSNDSICNISADFIEKKKLEDEISQNNSWACNELTDKKLLEPQNLEIISPYQRNNNQGNINQLNTNFICDTPADSIEKSKHKNQISQDVSPEICQSPNKSTLNQAIDEKTRKLQYLGIISPYLKSNNRGDLEFNNILISQISEDCLGEQKQADQEITIDPDDSLEPCRSLINLLSKRNPEIKVSDRRSNNQGDINELNNDLISKTSKDCIDEQKQANQDNPVNQDDSAEKCQSINFLTNKNPEIKGSDRRSNNQGDINELNNDLIFKTSTDTDSAGEREQGELNQDDSIESCQSITNILSLKNLDKTCYLRSNSQGDINEFDDDLSSKIFEFFVKKDQINQDSSETYQMKLKNYVRANQTVNSEDLEFENDIIIKGDLSQSDFSDILKIL